MATFEQVMALATLPETRLPLCLDAKLAGELDALRAQLADAQPPTSLGQRSPAAVITDQINELVTRMKAAEVTFVLRALPGSEWDEFWLGRPVRDEGEPDKDFAKRLFPWMAGLVSRCCIDPVMTPEQVGLLVDKLHGYAWTMLHIAAQNVNTGEVEVPNYASVSEQTPASDQTSKPPTPSASLTPPSSAANGAKRPRTPTKKAASSAA